MNKNKPFSTVTQTRKRAEKALLLAQVQLNKEVDKELIENHALELMTETEERLDQLLQETLQPCPNPGCCSDGFQLKTHENFDYVECTSCGTRGPIFDGHPEDAINGWNDLSQTQEIQRLKDWVTDLQSGLYINCVYCGHRYGPKEDTPVAMADVLKEHIAHCPEHPLSHANEQIQKLEALVVEFVEYLESHDECEWSYEDHPIEKAKILLKDSKYGNRLEKT